MNMTIAKALKEKNRISGRIVKLQNQIKRHNRVMENGSVDFDIGKLFISLQEEWAHLIDLKSKIAKANVGICDKLIQLSEAKAELQFWTNFNAGPKREVGYTSQLNADGMRVNAEVVYVSYFDHKDIDDHINSAQKLIEDLQDEIDNYNATTKI